MFADLPGRVFEIEEGNELIGFAVAVDENGNPCWLDFVIAGGGKWQYRKGETCQQGHSLNKTTTIKLLDSKEASVECNICKIPIANLNKGYFTCQDVCNFYCCKYCFNYKV